ncbi:MAG TPA: cytochrome c, class I [Gammaproteobacteria bacterium]|nr:cytochrome c, class I [Gammaproteobacteria bacterium]
MSQSVKTHFLAGVLVAFAGLSAASAQAADGGLLAAAPGAHVLVLAEVSAANTFNRNLRKEKDPNAPPPEDGYHDPENEATHVLQPPKEAYVGLPTTEFGNHVDWVKALDQGKLAPRWDRFDPSEEPFVMDLDIVRPVKASVPDVVFPHRQHTLWLHCSNCHPAIFIPQKRANQINMSAILLGQKCGVCHGKVSFPIMTKTCKKCHSKPKPADWTPPLSEATLKNPWR